MIGTTLLALISFLAVQDKTSEKLLKEADALMADARKLYEEGKANGNVGGLIEAGFKADEARVKYQAVQQIASGENQKRARLEVRNANSLIKLVNDARVALQGGGPKPPAKPKPKPDATPAPATPRPAAPAAPAAPVPPENPLPKGPRIDLLKHIQKDKDVLEGMWMARPGKLLLGSRRGKGKPWPRIQIPYRPPEEYDVLMKFRHTGNGEVVLLLSKGGKPFAFEMGVSENRVFSLTRVKSPPGNPATLKIEQRRCLEGAREYTAWVQVRNDSIKAYLNNLLIAYTPLNEPDDLSLPMKYALRHESVLGVAAANQLVISSIEIIEVKGKGKPLR